GHSRDACPRPGRGAAGILGAANDRPNWGRCNHYEWFEVWITSDPCQGFGLNPWLSKKSRNRGRGFGQLGQGCYGAPVCNQVSTGVVSVCSAKTKNQFRGLP